MRPVLHVAPLLLLAAACSGEDPVQVREAAALAPASPVPAAQPAAGVPAQPEILELGDGLVVEVLVRGEGGVAQRGGEILVHYTARVAGAEQPFDSSWSRGVPDRWRLSTRARPRLIEGLVRGLVGLPAGTRCLLRIPAPLGFGSEGREPSGIPPDADLVYEVRLLEALP